MRISLKSQPLFFQTTQNIPANGLEKIVTVTGQWNGPTGPVIKDTGETTKLTGMENSSIQMEPPITEPGKTTKPMVMGYLFTPNSRDMTGNGKMTFNMVLARRSGQMAAFFRGILFVVKKMDQVIDNYLKF